MSVINVKNIIFIKINLKKTSPGRLGFVNPCGGLLQLTGFSEILTRISISYLYICIFIHGIFIVMDVL